jgi:uncharacterized protein
LPDTDYITDLSILAEKAREKEEENDHFLRSLKKYDDAQLDAIVHEINDVVSAGIDCTACGNCCKTLIINITQEEIKGLADFMQLSEAETREKYIEESMAGNTFISSVPCHFLSGSMCSIYPQRFTECRDFPHLHKPGFKKRFSGTLLHYGNCPIVYNVVEEVKRELGFFE